MSDVPDRDRRLFALLPHLRAAVDASPEGQQLAPRDRVALVAWMADHLAELGVEVPVDASPERPKRNQAAPVVAPPPLTPCSGTIARSLRKGHAGKPCDGYATRYDPEGKPVCGYHDPTTRRTGPRPPQV